MLYPMFCVFLVTVVIGYLMVKARFVAVRQQALKANYFKLMQGSDAPEQVIKTSRCFNNMFEMPTVFYIVCSLHLLLGLESYYSLIIAWLYVVFRIAHSYIHLSYNHLAHRRYAFGLSVICICLLWINLLLATI